MDSHDENSSVSRSDIEKTIAINNEVGAAEVTSLQHPDIEVSQPRSEKEDCTQAPSVLDWNGENDPDNPHNWSLAIRLYNVVIPGLFGFAV